MRSGRILRLCRSLSQTGGLLTQQQQQAALFYSSQSLPGARLRHVPKEDGTSLPWWPKIAVLASAAVAAATLAAAAPAWADAGAAKGPPDASSHSLLSLKTRQRLFFAYEKRIRCGGSNRADLQAGGLHACPCGGGSAGNALDL